MKTKPIFYTCIIGAVGTVLVYAVKHGFNLALLKSYEAIFGIFCGAAVVVGLLSKD